MANKKKSIDQAREESRKNKKNSTNKRKKYYARTITDLDFVEVKKQFPYIEKDAKGIYYINTQGEREEIHFPYLPLPDDDTCKMILYRETMNQEKGKFLFQVIDNIDKVIEPLERGKMPIAWKLAPNRKVSAMKKGQGYKIYSISKGTKLLPLEVLKLTKDNDTRLHKVIMALVFPKEMQKYREENDKKPGSRQVDHISGNELDCRIRNMWVTDKQLNLRGKTKFDMQMLLDRTCIYYKKDEEGNYIYDSKKFVLVLMLGDYKQAEWEILGKGEIIEEDNRKDDKIYILDREKENATSINTKTSQYNFIEQNGGRGNIVIASFKDFESMNQIYEELIFTKDGEKTEHIEERNKKVFEFFSNCLNKDAEKIPGLEKIVLLADTNEIIENGESYVYFDNITTQEKDFLKAKKRGIFISKVEDQETQKRVIEIKSIANQKVSSDNIIDILYPYFNEILK